MAKLDQLVGSAICIARFITSWDDCPSVISQRRISTQSRIYLHAPALVSRSPSSEDARIPRAGWLLAVSSSIPTDRHATDRHATSVASNKFGHE